MGLIPEDKIAEVRDRTDIVQVVGEYVTLKRAGTNHKGLCPFHQEKTPSFNVSAPKRMFYCFGCQKSGDVIRFLMEVEGKSFIETVRELAKRAGVDLPEPERSREAIERQRRAESEREKLVRVNEIACAFYRTQLTDGDSEAAAQARAYVEKRGIKADVAEKFQLGYAPAGWEALVRCFEAKKVPHELAEKAGLVRRRERAGTLPLGAPPTKATHFDMFVDRVVYPLTSHVGVVLGFGGRLMVASEDQPKYKNSPETPIYKKGENLFGLHLAKHAIRKGGKALLVEGNFDVMTLHACGIEYAIAPQGTAITAEQVGLMGRFADEVVVMLDADPAGRAATMKVIRLFVAAGMKARIAQLRSKDGGKVDPDDLAKNDLKRLEHLIDTAQDAVEFFFDQVISTSDPTVPGKARAIEECAPLLAAVGDPLTRELYVAKLAQLLRVDAGLVQRALRSARPMSGSGNANGNGNGSANANESGNASEQIVARGIELAHEKLLAFLAHHGTLVTQIDTATLDAITDQAVRALIVDAQGRGTFQADHALATAAPEIRQAVAKALLSEEFASDGEPKKILTALVDGLRLPTSPEALEAERRAAIARGDVERAQFLTTKILSSRRLQKVS